MLTNKVEISGVNTFNLPVISNDKMKELFSKLARGSERAREELVKSNLRLVLSILQRFKNRGEYVDDLFQVGCIGLMKAIDNFNLEQNVNFSTYAVPMIIGEIKRYLRDNNPIHISRSIKSLSCKVQEVREKLTQEHRREVTVDEIAADLGLTSEEVVYAFNATYDPLSLYDPVFTDSTDPVYIIDLIGDQGCGAENCLEGLAIQEALEQLPLRERQILSARFFKGLTQMEVAVKIGISQAQVSRLEKRALRMLRAFYRKDQVEGDKNNAK